MRSGVMTALCVVVALGAVAGFAAQEHDPSKPPTRQWQLGWIPDNRGHETELRVTVISTSGVCLYVVSGREFYADEKDYGMGDSSRLAITSALGRTAAVAAVPKTQLPPGVGCQ